MRFLTTLAFCLFLMSTGWSQTPFFPFEDTFDGSNMDDPVTWWGVPLFEGAVAAPAIEMTGGQLKLSGATSLVPFGLDFSVGVVEVQSGGQAVIAGDGITAQTVFNLPENALYASIYTKGGEDQDSYFANINSEGLVNMGNFADVVNQSSFPTNIQGQRISNLLQTQDFGQELCIHQAADHLASQAVFDGVTLEKRDREPS